jgi:hypothetical protein
MTLVSASALFLLYTHEEKQNHPSLAASAAAASEGSKDKEAHTHTRGHHTPIYDINIESKKFPKEVPVFIEVAKVGLCVLVELVELGGRWMDGGWMVVEV